MLVDFTGRPAIRIASRDAREIRIANRTVWPVATENVLAANRTWFATTSTGFSAVATSRRSHFAHSHGDVSDLVFVDTGRYMSGTGVWTNVSYTIKRFIEYPIGDFTQVTWDGQPQITVASGSTVESDALPITIPKGAQFFERTVHLGGSIPRMALPNYPASLGLPDGNSVGDFGDNGDISASSTTMTSFGAIGIRGTVHAANARGVLLLGDSIIFGLDDMTGVGAKGGSGYMARAIDPQFAWAKIAVSGQQAAEFANLIGFTQLRTIIQALGVTDAWMAYGLNDLNTASAAPETIIASCQTIADGLRACGVQRVHQSTIGPSAESTDDWATVENQTPATSGNLEAIPEVNALIRSRPAYLDGTIFDVADIAMSAHDSGVWATPPKPVFDDRTHPNSYMSGVIADALSAQVAALK